MIGQQGGGAVVWETQNTFAFKNMLEEGERAKWDYIASELSRIRSKKFTATGCQKRIKELFDEDPSIFGIVVGNAANVLMNSYPQQQQLNYMPHHLQQPENLDLMHSQYMQPLQGDYLRRM